MPLIIDEANPCAAAAALRAIYYEVVAGKSVSEVEFKAGPNGVARRVRYSGANADGLLRVIQKFEGECDAAQGKRPGRFGLATGGRF